MLDLIPRHLANLYNGNGIPSPTKIIITGRRALVRDNIWFFLPTNGRPSTITGFQDGTYENPALGLSQAQINTINALAPNASFYINSGVYNNPAVGNGYSFFNGQSIYGRMNYFALPAVGDNRPLVNDSFLLNGNNNLENMRINGQMVTMLDTGGSITPVQTGVFITQASTGVININNSQINSTSSQFGTMALASNSDSAATVVNVSNSQLISATTNSPIPLTIGAGNLGTGTLNFINTSILTSSINTSIPGNLALGLVNNESGTINFANSSLALTLVNGGFAAGVLNNSTLGVGTINLSGSNITVAGNNPGNLAGVLNQANNPFGNSGIVNINNTLINVSLTNAVGGTAFGVSTSGNGVVNINNAAINISGDSGTLIGLLVSDPTATINFANTIISLSASGTAVRVPFVNNGTLNVQGGNRFDCYQDGVQVPC